MSAVRKFVAADLFCGGGGFSKGFALACETLGIRNVRLIAINHSQVAVETHKANHPWAEHHCARVDQLDPRRLVPEGRMKILIASPECTNHANARGGRPINDQSRATAWDVVKWAQELYIENILIENVREIQEWGPLGANGRPLQSKKGEVFRQWIEAIKACGYKLEHRILNAADFGGATTRHRFFLIARRGNRRIVWPEQTHSKDATKTGDLFKRLKPWRAAREIIDWNLKGESIFNRKKPLAKNTLARIEAGLRKFGGPAAEPFIVVLRGSQKGQINGSARSVDQPAPTIVANGTHLGLCEPFLVGLEQTKSNGAQVRPVNHPIPSVTTAGRIGLVEPFILPNEGFYKGNAARSLHDPLNTVTSRGAGHLVQPFIVGCGGPQQAGQPQPVDKPLGTVLTRNHKALVQPFLVNYNGNGKPHSVEKPIGTIPTVDRFGLVEPKGNGILVDIHFRMLEPHELARAMGFEGYEFKGSKKHKVKMIGNAVEVNTAKALCKAILGD